MKKKILIPYASYGSGHKAIARYIEKYFKEQVEIQNKVEEMKNKNVTTKKRVVKYKADNKQINNNFIQANTLPLQQRNKNGF